MIYAEQNGEERKWIAQQHLPQAQQPGTSADLFGPHRPKKGDSMLMRLLETTAPVLETQQTRRAFTLWRLLGVIALTGTLSALAAPTVFPAHP